MFETSHFHILDRSRVITDQTNLFISQMNHFTDHGAQKTGLTRANFADNDCKGAFLDLDVKVLQADNLIQGAIPEGDMIVQGIIRVEVVKDTLPESVHVFSFLFVGLLHHLLSNLVLLTLIHFGRDGPAEATTDSNSVLRIFIVSALNETLLGFGRAVVHPELVKAPSNVEDASVEVSDPADRATELINHHLGKDHLTESHCVSEALVDIEGDKGDQMVK